MMVLFAIIMSTNFLFAQEFSDVSTVVSDYTERTITHNGEVHTFEIRNEVYNLITNEDLTAVIEFRATFPMDEDFEVHPLSRIVRPADMILQHRPHTCSPIGPFQLSFGQALPIGGGRIMRQAICINRHCTFMADHIWNW